MKCQACLLRRRCQRSRPTLSGLRFWLAYAACIVVALLMAIGLSAYLAPAG